MQLHKTAGPENVDTNYHLDLVLLGGTQLYIHIKKQKYAV